jgi:transcriptional regulator with XRE-family HTH domain
MSASIASGGTDIGRRIREQRERVGLSRAETAERAGLAPEYLVYLEVSPDCMPTQATLIRVAAALGTSVSALSGAGLNVPPGQRGVAANPVLTSLSADECQAGSRSGRRPSELPDGRRRCGVPHWRRHPAG